MTSSFSLFLSGPPATFRLDLEFQAKEDGEKCAAVEVAWDGAEPWNALRQKLEASFRDFHASSFCERCEVHLQMTTPQHVAVEIEVHTEQPILQSLTFSRLNGNSPCDERYIVKALGDLDLTTVTRVQCYEGFPFFLPAVVPLQQWQSLEQLHLVNAGLMALPPSLGNYALLRELRLSHNRLTALPRELGDLKHLEVFVADHNQLVAIPADLCDCCHLQDLNLEFNCISTVVLDLRKFPKLHSLQLYGNPLKYIPELSVCQELRSLSLMNLRVWSDSSYSQFEVTIEGTTALACGTKLNPLFSVLFSRSSSQHPLMVGALGRLAEFRINCDAILEQPGAPLQQLILMVLSPQSVVQEQTARVIGLIVHSVSTAETLVKNGILDALLTVLEAERPETKTYALKALSVMAMTSDGIAVSLLSPTLVKKLRSFIDPSIKTSVRHRALETLGNLAFAMENRHVLLSVTDVKSSLKDLASSNSPSVDRRSRLLACRCLSVLGEHDAVDAILGRPPRENRGIRILAIDGGGMKGLAAVKMLQELESRTGRRIWDLFDLIGGTSSGAMLAISLGILKYSLQQCDEIYKKLGYRVFNQAHQEEQTGWKDSLIRMYRSGQQGLRVVIAGCKHDASTFEVLLQEMCRSLEEKATGPLYIDSAVLGGPKVFAASTLTSIVPAMPFLFRNYEFSVEKTSAKMRADSSLGSSKFHLWQGVRASSAAPYFFEDFKLDGLHFQDGATTANNPTALAVQQAKLLWPEKSIDCVISIGLGAVPAAQREKSSSSFIENGSVLIESSCSVERTHEAMSLMTTMLPEMNYFRFNPVDKRCDLGLDDLDAEKWSSLEVATLDYIEKNASLFAKAAEILTARKDTYQPIAPISNGSLWKEQRPLVIVRALRERRDGEQACHPLHFLDYSAGTVDVPHRHVLSHEACCKDFRLSSLAAAPVAQGKAFLQAVSAEISGQTGAVHLDMETTNDNSQLIIQWSTKLWSVIDPSPEAATLKSSLGVEDSISLAEALKHRTMFHYGDGYCQWVAQQDFHFPVPTSLHLFARSDPDEIMRPRDIPSLHSLIKNAVISSTRHLSDDLVQSFLRSGASAVLCLAAEDDHRDLPLSDRLCFLKMFYDALYAGQINHTAFQHVQSVMPHLKNVYQLFQ